MAKKKPDPQPAPDVLPPITTEIAEYSPTAAALTEMRARVAGHTFDCTTTAGDTEARQSRLVCVRLRTALDAKRKEIKAPALERCRLIDVEAKRIEDEILKIENPIDAVIRAEEARREAIRKEREAKEAAILKARDAALASIVTLPLTLLSATSADLDAAINALQQTPIACDPPSPDFEARLQAAKRDTLGQLMAMRQRAEQAEVEVKKLAEERAENERIRNEAAERARQIQAAHDAELKEAQERAAEERRQAEEAAKAQREADAAQQAALDDIRQIPIACIGKTSAELAAALTELSALDDTFPGVPAAWRDRFVEANTVMLAKLMQMHDAALAKEANERAAAEERKDLQEAQARQAEADAQAAREAAEREKVVAEQKRKAQEKADADAIANTDLQTAAAEAIKLLTVAGFGEHLTTRKLQAALERFNVDQPPVVTPRRAKVTP
jgi:hypothetical protein